jgi:hypothetical protein
MRVTGARRFLTCAHVLPKRQSAMESRAGAYAQSYFCPWSDETKWRCFESDVRVADANFTSINRPLLSQPQGPPHPEPEPEQTGRACWMTDDQNLLTWHAKTLQPPSRWRRALLQGLQQAPLPTLRMTLKPSLQSFQRPANDTESCCESSSSGPARGVSDWRVRAAAPLRVLFSH